MNKNINLANFLSFLALVFIALAILTIKTPIPSLLFLSGAVICDILDGIVARYFKITTNFGVIFDSFNDFFIYLVYPLILIYISYQFFSPFMIIAMIVFIFTGVFRLARQTNINLQNKKFDHYVGLPVVFSLFLLLTLKNQSISLVYLFIISLLMISTIKFKKPFVEHENN